MKHIELTKGEFALVDNEDYEYLNQFRWGVQNNKKRKYAYRKIYDSSTKKSHTIYMHRELNSLTDNKIHVDHIDGDGLNNQRSNLRLCSNAQNLMNAPMKSNNKSGIKGIYWDKDRQKWAAKIRVNRKNKYLGRFDNKRDAALAYNKAALEYFGEFAYLNEI